ncbi:MAG: SusC/RagA family TonB-linked outer membrane protein, partial [Alistipes sp.]|nr:SusC/RagA family TonB-linked outer membrane protein [Alistipes sp.]
ARDLSSSGRGAAGTVCDVTIYPHGDATPKSGLDELFCGKGAAGLGIRQTDGAPGATFGIEIRGLKSFRGTSEPLIILDGVMLNDTSKDAAQAFRNDADDYQALQNTLSAINPNDIAKIEVLKDAAATAIYGAYGANGVILITTKMGSDDNSRSEVVRYHGNIGISTMYSGRQMLSGEEYVAMMQAANPDIAVSGTPADMAAAATRTALVHSHYVSAAGSKERMRHFLSLGYDSAQGVIDRTAHNSLNMRVNIERTINKGSLIGVRGSFGHSRTDMTQATAPLGAMSTVRAMTMGMPLHSTETYSSSLDDTPAKWLAAYDDTASEYFVTQSLYFRAALVDGLALDVDGGIDYRSKERMRWVGSQVWRGAVEQGRAAKSDNRQLGYNASARLRYEKTFGGRHALTGLLGATFDGNSRVNDMLEGYKFFNETLRAQGIQLAENVQPAHVLRTASQQASLFASAAYAFDGRYTVNAGVRGDYTLDYDPDFGKMTYYPWVSASWNLMAEPFMPRNGIVSQLRLRGGWGRSGRQTLDTYDDAQRFITGVAPDIELENGIANYCDIRWNTMNDEWNVGFDSGMFGDRLTVSASYYESESTDRLRYYYHKREGDYRAVYSNSAVVSNRGVEVGIDGRIVQGREWNFSLGASFSYNRNRIVSTGAADNGDVFGNPVGSWFGREVTVNVNRQGQSVGSFYGDESQGIVLGRHMLYTPPFQGCRLQAGDIKIIDTDGPGNVTESAITVIGNPLPLWRYGLTADLSWRNLSLRVDMDGAADFDIMNLDLLNTATYRTGNTSNLRRSAYTEAYPAGREPRMNATGGDVVSSRFVEDGSYLRLSSISISYRFDIGRKRLSSIDLSLTAKNLCVLTGYSGSSPLVNSYGSDLSRYGLDNASYPLARTFLLSIKATF